MLKQHKNYRSNTSDNPKLNAKVYGKREAGKIDEFAKNASGIRQYFKGKSAGSLNKNSRGFSQKSKDFVNNNSNEIIYVFKSFKGMEQWKIMMEL